MSEVGPHLLSTITEKDEEWQASDRVSNRLCRWVPGKNCDIPTGLVGVQVGIEKSASHLIASDRKWPTNGSQARRLVRKTRRLSGGFHDFYRGVF